MQMHRNIIIWVRGATRRWVALCVAALGVAVGAMGAHLEATWPHWHVEFGDVPTWTGAIGAIIAAAFAGGAFMDQREQVIRLTRNAAAADRLLKYQDHEASQAFARAVRIDWKVRELRRIKKGAPATTRLEGSVGNGSGGAITNLVVRVCLDGALLDNFHLRPLRMTKTGEWGYTWHLSPDGSEIRQGVLDSGDGISWTTDVPGAISNESVNVLTRFTDEVGTRWEVGGNKTPVPVADGTW